jgi:hypothetical protein
MRRALIIVSSIVVVVGALGAAAIYTQTGRYLLLGAIGQIAKPHHGWDLAFKAPSPDYSKAGSWAALPGHPSPANFVPEGSSAAQDARVDVFFIHPTGYMKGYDWNSPLDPKSATEENTKWMMANQASAFNGCCNVFAPRYREASIMTYIAAPPDVRTKAMDLAYGDVERAFDYFLEHYSRGRPFIIASHSQGTAHGFRLLKERIDGSPLAQRMVAAYLLGGGIQDAEADALKTMHVCNSPTDIHCLVQWDTWGEHGSPYRDPHRGKTVCVNPVSWKRDGAMTDAVAQKGAAPTSGIFSVRFFGGDTANDVEFKPLGKPLRAYTHAECRNGLLLVDDQKGAPFAKLDMGGENYHGLDYPLFHMDIRENAIARVNAYLAQMPQRDVAGR